MPSLYDTVRYNNQRGGLTDGLDNVYRTIKQSESEEARLAEQGRQFDQSLGEEGRQFDQTVGLKRDTHNLAVTTQSNAKDTADKKDALANKVNDTTRYIGELNAKAQQTVADAQSKNADSNVTKAGSQRIQVEQETAKNKFDIQLRMSDVTDDMARKLHTISFDQGIDTSTPEGRELAIQNPIVREQAGIMYTQQMEMLAALAGGGRIERRPAKDKDGNIVGDSFFHVGADGEAKPLAQVLGLRNNPVFQTEEALARALVNRTMSDEVVAEGAQRKPNGSPAESALAIIRASNEGPNDKFPPTALPELSRLRLKDRYASAASEEQVIKNTGLRQTQDNEQRTADLNAQAKKASNSQTAIANNAVADDDTIAAAMSDGEDTSSFFGLFGSDGGYEAYEGDPEKARLHVDNSLSNNSLGIAKELGYGMTSEDEAAKLFKNNPEARKRAVGLIVRSMKDSSKGDPLTIYSTKKKGAERTVRPGLWRSLGNVQ